MVIGVSFQVKEDKIAVDMIAVPRVMRETAFVLVLLVFQSQQAIVFDIVGACQLPPCEDIVDDKKGNHLPAESDNQSELHRGR